MDIQSFVLSFAFFAALWVLYGKPIRKAGEKMVQAVQEVPIEENVVFYQKPSARDFAIYQALLDGAHVIREGDCNTEQSADQKELESVFGPKDYSTQKVGFDCNYVAAPVRARAVAVEPCNLPCNMEQKAY